MCVDNAMVRFQTVDYREPTAGNRKERAGFERAQTVPIGSRIEVTSNSISENIHLGVLGFGSSSSPTGSDTLAAPPLNELYRYHVFFSHCPQDVGWVQEVVARLEAPPYNYRCAASPDSPQDAASLEQNLLCAAMLSERVVLVLSKQYVQETWFTFEKVLRQLTQMSLHNQRIMGVLLEDCDIPETLGELYFLDTSDPDFFHVFSKRLKTGPGTTAPAVPAV
nr:hypothetical protein BaRGS_008154 [Batillaria attramentaria]